VKTKIKTKTSFFVLEVPRYQNVGLEDYATRFKPNTQTCDAFDAIVVDAVTTLIVGVSNTHPMTHTPATSNYERCGHLTAAAGARSSVICTPQEARYVIVQIETTTAAKLSLCEVEVYTAEGTSTDG